jgi:hypothetical protein
LQFLDFEKRGRNGRSLYSEDLESSKRSESPACGSRNPAGVAASGKQALFCGKSISPRSFFAGWIGSFGISFIEAWIANEPFHGKKSGKLGWYSRVCGRIGIIDYLDINKCQLSR